MHLRWLELTDFRCYLAVTWRPVEGLNVLLGPNGAGKTSLVEGIAYLGALRSFRGVADIALVRAGAGTAIARGGIADGTGETVVEVELPTEGRRRVRLNGKRPQRLRDVISRIPVVTFDPDDLALVKGAAGERRRYLDDLAARLWPSAGAEQDDYERTVRQRNALLRAEGSETPDDELDVWDARLADTGARVTMRRLRLLDMLRPVLLAVYEEVAGTDDAPLVANYTSKSWSTPPADEEETATAIVRRLGERRRLDRERRVTSAGPHRDEPGLELAGRDVRSMASQGEQRTAALALRFGAFDLLRDRAATAPLLILDDVFSELDGTRAQAVVRRLPEGQVFASTTRVEDAPAGGRRWEVGGGTVTAQ